MSYDPEFLQQFRVRTSSGFILDEQREARIARALAAVEEMKREATQLSADVKKHRHCSNCGEAGHNRCGCTHPYVHRPRYRRPHYNLSWIGR